MGFGFINTTIFLLSFTILSLQVILGVVFNALSFAPFFAISFSLLGLTLAGVFVYLRYRNRTNVDFEATLLKYLYILGLLLVFYTILLRNFSLIPFIDNTDAVTDIYWNRLLIKAIGSSLGIGLVFIFAFFSLGIIYALIYRKYSQQSPKVYFFDLIGASLGCVFGTVVLNYLQPSSSILLLSLFVFCLAFFYEYSLKAHHRLKALIYVLVCSSLLVINIKTDFFEIKVNDHHQFWTKAMPFYQEVWHRWNIYSRTTLLRNTQPNNPVSVPTEYTFSIVDGRAKVVGFNPQDPYSLKPDVYFASVLSFLLQEPKDILVLMAGAGREMVEAYSYSKGNSDITGVELNGLIIDKTKTIAGYNLGIFFKLPNVHMINQEGRSYIESTDKKFDSIVLPWSGATGMQCLGIANYTPQYLYTSEAFESYLKHLKPGGTIVVVDCNKIKVLAMARAAFDKLKIQDIAHKVILLGDEKEIISGSYKKRFTDSHDRIGVVIKNSDFTEKEVEEIKLKLLPMKQGYIYNPYFTRDGLKVYEDLLKSEDVDSFINNLSVRYNRNFIVPRDDAPFINIMFKKEPNFRIRHWAKFLDQPSSLDERERFFNVFMIYFMNFLLVLGLFCIVIPLFINAKKDSILKNYRVWVYFMILGLGFIFVEIAIMHSFVLLMGNPIYSFAVVLASLLLSAGVGSWLSECLFQKQIINFKKLSISVAVLLCCYFVLISNVNKYLLWLPLWSKLLLTVVFIFPLGITLGMFFPQGLKTFSDKNRDLIPLAWGINGYMSIIGSLLCINLSRSVGFSIFLLYAAILYIMLVFFHPKTS